MIALIVMVFALVPAVRQPFLPREHPLAKLATTHVRRSDLNVVMTASGRVESSNATMIQCELEALDAGVRGNRIAAGGASTILSIIPDGSVVKKGEVLCVLDSSDYEELERQQDMNVLRARADHQQALLTLDVARTAVLEYRDGLMVQSLRDLEGRITLSRADLERAGDRLVWTKRMVEKGYFPQGQAFTDELALNRMTFGLSQGQTSLRLFKQFSAPKYLKILQSEVSAAESIENFQSRRVARSEERLAYMKRQIAACTIVAPHDGFLIYANEDMRQVRIEAGMTVRQKQRLFYLPDLSRMEVNALIHETVVDEVKPGMFVKVKVEALNGRELYGHVQSVAPLPQEASWFSDVKYFVSKVKLDTIPEGLKPGMTAEVRIQTTRKTDVLTVPTEAVTSEDGHDVCYVAFDDHLQRREVRLGQASPNFLEITDGLDEGEEVITDPEHIPAAVAAAADEEDLEPTRVHHSAALPAE